MLSYFLCFVSQHWPLDDFFYDKLWNAMHPRTQLFHYCSSFLQYWILWYWLTGRYQKFIPHIVCLWQEHLPLNGNHASSLHVLHRKTPSISCFLIDEFLHIIFHVFSELMLLIFWWYASNPHLSSKQRFIWRSSNYCVRYCSICHHSSHYFCFVICFGHLWNCCRFIYFLHVVFYISICLRMVRI